MTSATRSNRKPISLDLREISIGKYSLVATWLPRAGDHNTGRRQPLLAQVASVIFSTHDRDFAIQQSRLYASQYKVPLTISIPV